MEGGRERSAATLTQSIPEVNGTAPTLNTQNAFDLIIEAISHLEQKYTYRRIPIGTYVC